MEKKKITARKPATAEEQEKALNLLLGKMTTEDALSADRADEMVKENKAKTTVKTAKKATNKNIEKAKRPATIVRRKAQDIVKPLVEVQRITIDLPSDLYDLLKLETEEKGTTLKWQIVSLLKEHFKKA